MSMMGLRLLASGSNGAGQLGLGHVEDVASFKQCLLETEVDVEEVVAMASGGSHTLLLVQQAVTDRVVLLGAGSNALGQLGDGPDSLVFSPLAIPGEPLGFYPAFIACAWTTSYIVYRSLSAPDVDAEPKPDVLIAIGSNDFDELGGPRPLELQAGEVVQSITSGQRHVIVVLQHRDTGVQRLVGWGAARHGQLSNPGSDVPSSALMTKGKGKALPRSLARPSEISMPPGVRVKRVAVGSTHTVYLTDDGKVISAGSNAKEQRADLPGAAEHVQNISCTWNGTYCHLSEGGRSIISTGSNTHGQLGRAESGTRAVQLPSGTSVQSMVCGSEHLLAILSPNNRLYACGWNEHGNLGVGDKTDRSTLVPVPVGSVADVEVTGIHAGCGTSFAWFS